MLCFKQAMVYKLAECVCKLTLAERERMGSPRGQFLTFFMDDHVFVKQMLPALVIVVE